MSDQIDIPVQLPEESVRKVHPIKGKHTTFSSMIAEAMVDARAKRGFVVYFDDEGTMYFGELDVRLGDACMAHGYLGMVVNQMMESL